MSVPVKRIAINVGGSYVPGLNAVSPGATDRAGSQLRMDASGLLHHLHRSEQPDVRLTRWLATWPYDLEKVAAKLRAKLGAGLESEGELGRGHEVEQDSSFYRESGGGITLSGGECQLQADFAAALLSGAHARGINTAIETAFNVPWSHVEKVLPHVDVVLHDHKLTDPVRHKTWTGVDNRRILENLKRAYETFPDKTFIARTPLIPGVNDDEEHIRAVLAFIKPYKNVVHYELLPYMRFGESKYGFLGKVYEMQDFDPPSSELLARLRAIINEAFGRRTEGR